METQGLGVNQDGCSPVPGVSRRPELPGHPGWGEPPAAPRALIWVWRAGCARAEVLTAGTCSRGSVMEVDPLRLRHETLNKFFLLPVWLYSPF